MSCAIITPRMHKHIKHSLLPVQFQMAYAEIAPAFPINNRFGIEPGNQAIPTACLEWQTAGREGISST